MRPRGREESNLKPRKERRNPCHRGRNEGKQILSIKKKVTGSLYTSRLYLRLTGEEKRERMTSGETTGKERIERRDLMDEGKIDSTLD